MNLSELNITIESIDALNLICYDNIANEYDEKEHETCRDFDTVTEWFLPKHIKKELFGKELRYLDIGVGTGKSLEFTLPWLEEMKAHVEVLDISPKMIEIVKSKFSGRIETYHTISIHQFKPQNKYDLIVATLCDPYLTKESINKFKRCLTEDGVLMISFPTNYWAKKVRTENINQTKFHDKSGNSFPSYSFCWNKGDLIKYMESNGFYLNCAKVMLAEDIVKLKGTLGSINKKLISSGKRVPVLLSLVFLNKDE